MTEQMEWTHFPETRKEYERWESGEYRIITRGRMGDNFYVWRGEHTLLGKTQTLEAAQLLCHAYPLACEVSR